VAKPYKDAHDLMVAGIGTPDKYHADWKAIADDLGKLVVASGFDPKGSGIPALIRAKVAAGTTEAATLRGGAIAAVSETGGGIDASKKRLLSLKTLRHLYFFESFGKQRIWILSLPEDLRAFPMEYKAESQSLIDQVLNAGNEKFGTSTMKDITEAAQTGLAWVQKAMVAVSSPTDQENRKLIRRWFIPAGATDEAKKITDLASTMKPQLQKIAAGLKSGSVILTDSPHERGSGSSLETSEAFVFTNNDLITVHVETDFFSTGNTLSGKTNWARIIVHELTHAYAKTKDHSYSWQGLLPRDTDVLKKGIDSRLTQNPGWKAVRTLTFDECKENADTWAFFIADCAGALKENDKMQALGQRIYDRAGETMEKPLAEKLKLRAGVQ